jgi:hypothetical protein
MLFIWIKASRIFKKNHNNIKEMYKVHSFNILKTLNSTVDQWLFKDNNNIHLLSVLDVNV